MNGRMKSMRSWLHVGASENRWSSTFRLSDAQRKLKLELLRDVPTKERHYRGSARSKISVTRILHAPKLRGMGNEESSYRPSKRQTHLVFSPVDMRPLGTANHHRPNQLVSYLLASSRE